MPTTTTDPTITEATLRAAIEGRDADAQIALYAERAEVTFVDAEHGPSGPLVLSGEALHEHLRGVCARDMSHHLSRYVSDGRQLAYEVECRYPDGTQVLCHCIATLSDGRIVRSRGVQAWDR